MTKITYRALFSNDSQRFTKTSNHYDCKYINYRYAGPKFDSAPPAHADQVRRQKCLTAGEIASLIPFASAGAEHGSTHAQLIRVTRQ